MPGYLRVTKKTKRNTCFFVILVAAFIAGCTGKSKITDNAPTTAVASKTVTLAISSMTCTECENTVKEAATKVEGVSDIKASFADSTAIVCFDLSKTSVEAIGAAITEAGYEFKGEKTAAVQVEAK